MPSTKFPRLTQWAIFSAILFVIALQVATLHPSSPIAVSLYKMHLLSLGGWGGYWLDRALFPYSRPHLHLLDDEDELLHGTPVTAEGGEQGFLVGNYSTHLAQWAMLRRAIIVAACLICVGLGA